MLGISRGIDTSQAYLMLLTVLVEYGQGIAVRDGNYVTAQGLGVCSAGE